jgi:hypothetical protein
VGYQPLDLGLVRHPQQRSAYQIGVPSLPDGSGVIIGSGDPPSTRERRQPL